MRLIVSLLFIFLLAYPFRGQAIYEPVCTESIKNNLWRRSTFRSDIVKLQKFLVSKGFTVPTVGLYGAQTEQAVTAYQKSLNIHPSGHVGYITRLAINSEICNIPLTNFDPSVVPTTDTTLYEKSVLLPILLIEQKYRLSCEAASAQMALLYKNISLNQDQIMWHIGWAKPYKSYTNQSGMVWGDPDIGFVGNEKGHVYVYPKGILGATGWGVNEGPVATMLKKFLPNSFSKKDATVQDIVQALDNKNPVIFWFKEDTMQQQTELYTTPLGKTVNFTTNHVALIVGYRIHNGNTEYLLNDPAYGRRSISENDLIRYWDRMDNRMVVVQ